MGSCKVNQVAGVRDDGAEPRRFDLRAELANLRGGNIAPAPLVGVLAEDLKRLAPMGHRALDGARQAARHRHMRPEPGTHGPSRSSRISLRGPTVMVAVNSADGPA